MTSTLLLHQGVKRVYHLFTICRHHCTRPVATHSSRLPFNNSLLRQNPSCTQAWNRSFCTNPTTTTETVEPEIPVIEYDSMKRIVDVKQVIILDVRKPNELIEEGAIPTAFNLPVDDIEAALKLDSQAFTEKYGFTKPVPSDKIIVFCRSGKRANRAGNILNRHDYLNVLNYRGSWNEWKERLTK